MRKLTTINTQDADRERLEELHKLTGRSRNQLWLDGLRLLWQQEMQGFINANNPNPRPEPKSDLPR